MLPFHQLADLFPLIEGKEFDDLVASIRESGQRTPIVLLNGEILDGRNRYRACEVVGCPPVTMEFGGGDPLKFVLDVNVHRRHLNESQRAMVATKLATLALGTNRYLSQVIDNAVENVDVGIPASTFQARPMTQAEAAKLLNVSRDIVGNARKILTVGTDDEVKDVEQGKVTVHAIIKKHLVQRTPKERRQKSTLNDVGKNPERIQRLKRNALIWGQLRGALESLAGLPLPADVVDIVKTQMGQRGTTDKVDQLILQAHEWLDHFAELWTTLDRTRDAA